MQPDDCRGLLYHDRDIDHSLCGQIERSRKRQVHIVGKWCDNVTWQEALLVPLVVHGG